MTIRKSLILGTAGHIDHGKTSLVKALTGVDTDRLPEEKARGITIDLGFAHWNLGDIDLSFIDVPGHERFVRNMLAGIGGIDLLILVVAADESIMPQTREHFDICRLLGIKEGCVALTKCDLVGEETLAVVRAEVEELTRGSFLEGAPVYAVSSRTGEGLDALKAGLQETLRRIEQRKPLGVFRLPVDRVFTLKGHGTVVTGTLLAGSLRREQTVEILPSHRKARVRSLHAHDQNVEEAIAGQRTALNLQGLEKDDVQRGDVLTEPGFFESSSLLNVQITLLPGARPILHNAQLRFHHQARDLLVRVTLPAGEPLEPGQSCVAQLRLQEPVFALYGDRFILRRHSPLLTVGGGIVVEHLPQKRIRPGNAAAFELIRKLVTATVQTRFDMTVAAREIEGAGESYLRARLAVDATALQSLRSEEVIVLRKQPLLCISTRAELKIRKRIVDVVSAFHAKNPLLVGIPKEELRTKFLGAVPPEVFAAILERAVAGKELQMQKDMVGAAGRRVALNTAEEETASRVEQELRKAGLEFPGFDGLAKSSGRSAVEAKKIVYLLVSQGRAVKLTDDYFLDRPLWEDLKNRIRSLKGVQKTFSVPDFKEKFGVSRKYAIPLLEHLDREGVTRRSGNERIIL